MNDPDLLEQLGQAERDEQRRADSDPRVAAAVDEGADQRLADAVLAALDRERDEARDDAAALRVKAGPGSPDSPDSPGSPSSMDSNGGDELGARRAMAARKRRWPQVLLVLGPAVAAAATLAVVLLPPDRSPALPEYRAYAVAIPSVSRVGGWAANDPAGGAPLDTDQPIVIDQARHDQIWLRFRPVTRHAGAPSVRVFIAHGPRLDPWEASVEIEAHATLSVRFGADQPSAETGAATLVFVIGPASSLPESDAEVHALLDDPRKSPRPELRIVRQPIRID